MNDRPAGRVYGFGPFRYDAGQRLLFRDGEVVPLAPKALETLQALLERHGRVVDKAELMKLVWPDTVVEEVGLARNISLLRKVLGDEAEPDAYIETISKRGYRFVAAVAEIGPAAEERPTLRSRWFWLTVAGAFLALGGLIYWQFYLPSRYLPRGAGFAGLAVVPFECLSPEAEVAAFSQGFSEVLVAELSKLNGVQVVSPSTVRRHQRMKMSMGLMGRLLGLEVLVEGTVQKLADRLRITARLVDVHTGKLIWAESYDRSLADPGRTQADLAHAIATQVGAHLAIHGQFPRASR